MQTKRHFRKILISLCLLALSNLACSIITVTNVSSFWLLVVVSPPGGKNIRTMALQPNDSRTIVSSLGGDYSVSVKKGTDFTVLRSKYQQQLSSLNNLTEEERKKRIVQLTADYYRT